MNQPLTLIDLVHRAPPNEFLPCEFRSPGFFLGKVDPRALEILNKEVNAIEQDFAKGMAWNHELAGQIKNEYFLKESYQSLAPYFIGIAHHYNRHFFGIEGKEEWELLDLWVNFQRKNEYNPPHNHRGMLSFTIWLRMPFDAEAEMEAVQSHKTTNACAANFAFLYNQADGKIAMENIPVDRRFEGVICVFPAAIHHTVYPFTTSDEFRVSIAGNLGPKGRYDAVK
jgi:hypothetical protein